jgi:general secretion pathway protein G
MRKPAPAIAGFSLIEIVMVIAIVALVAAFAWPAFEGYIDRSRVTETTVRITEMQKTIRDYEIAKGALPDDLAEVGFSDRRDPWGRPYEYLNLRTLKGGGKARKDKGLKPLNSDFDLYSSGVDGLSEASLAHSASRDDIVRARDGRFVGLASVFDP